MLTNQQREAQDQCIRVCQLKLGDGPEYGHYVDLADGQSPCDWWFYSKWVDGQIDCYPVTEDDIEEAVYPILFI